MLYDIITKSIEEGTKLVGYRDEIRAQLSEKPRSIVILDDDPTGTQTVHDIPVITEWSEEMLEKELLDSPVFFILTNSRSLQPQDADDLGRLLGQRLKKLAAKHKKKLLVVSRSDSTLRGHYPDEVNALLEGLGIENAKHILSPAFFEGGRYTFDDVHYVQEGEAFIPAAETPFARDNTFGYTASNLKEWIREKSKGRVAPEKIASLSIDQLRNTDSQKTQSILEDAHTSHFVVNATAQADLENVALASLKTKTPLVFRTGASFVNAITGIVPASLLEKEEIIKKQEPSGALVVVGSYVPKTSRQVEFLKKEGTTVFLKLDVPKILEKEGFQFETKKLSSEIDSLLASKQDVLLYTSRTVVKGDTKAESLEIVNRVSEALIAIVKALKVRPRYILAKGGITSSDVATKALSVRRALIIGQLIKGVPVWKLGEEAKFPDMPYIVFPGNVGGVSALYDVTHKLK